MHINSHAPKSFINGSALRKRMGIQYEDHKATGIHDFSFRKLRMPDWNRSMPKPMPSSNPCGRILSSVGKLRQHRIMGQGDSAGDFDPSESMENAGILDVFPIFHTVRLGQKIR